MKLPSNMSWVKQHYEKAILIAVLLALVGSAAYLGNHLSTRAAALKASERPVVAGPEQGFADLSFSGYSNGLVQLASPVQAAGASNRLFISEIRVFCVRCGKWIGHDDLKCPFCEAAQPPIDPPADADSDRDGLPDVYEEKHGMDAYNPDDARLDTDGDGFTALEEFVAGTNPKAAADRPSLFAKLRLAGVQQLSFKLRFVAVQKLSDTLLKFQINARSLDRTFFPKIGDVVEGYTVDSYDKAADTLTLKRGDIVKKLQRGKVIDDDQLVVHFVFLLDGSKPRCLKGESFNLGDQKARLVDIAPDRNSVKIQHEGGREYIVSKPTADESAAMQLRVANPMSGASETPGVSPASKTSGGLPDFN